MNTSQPARDQRIAEWWFEDVLQHRGQLPKGNFALVYMKALMNLAAADGTLTDDERKWVVGFASTVGLGEDLIEKLKVYQHGTCPEAEKMFDDIDMPYVTSSRLGLIFFAFRAASADGQLKTKEIEGIYKIAKRLGLDEKQIQDLHYLSDEEDRMRQKRSAILYPQGLTLSMKTYEEQFS